MAARAYRPRSSSALPRSWRVPRPRFAPAAAVAAAVAPLAAVQAVPRAVAAAVLREQRGRRGASAAPGTVAITPAILRGAAVAGLPGALQHLHPGDDGRQHRARHQLLDGL